MKKRKFWKVKLKKFVFSLKTKMLLPFLDPQIQWAETVPLQATLHLLACCKFSKYLADSIKI